MLETIKKEPYEATKTVDNWLRNRRNCHETEIKELVITRTNFIELIDSKTIYYFKWIRTGKNEWTRKIAKMNNQKFEEITFPEKEFWEIIYDNIKWSIGDTLVISIKY